MRPKQSRIRQRILSLLFATHLFANAQAQEIPPVLNGVGLFQSTSTAGIPGASFEGGTEILFSGQPMSHSPADFTVLFANSNLGGTIAGPPLSQDNHFNSYTDGGRLQYTTPSLFTLLQLSRPDLQTLDFLWFDLNLLDVDSMTSSINTLKCDPSNSAPCRITYSRAYTPILYYMQPPLAYYGSEVAFWVDPKSAQTYKTSTEWPFTEARIDGQTIDFEEFVDETTVLSGYNRNQVRGFVGKVQPKKSASVNFKFKAGNSMHFDDQMIRCSYDNLVCYKAKTLAVINSISATSGYVTGGQLLTIKGYGFNSKNIDVKVDGAQCVVQTYTQDQFTCKTGTKATPSTDTNFVGQHGLRRQIFNTTTQLSYALLATTDHVEKLALSFEAQYNYKDGYYGNIYTGYFKAPATAKYRFYGACDDNCQLYFSNTPMDPSKKELILNLGWTSYRKYFTEDNNRVSEWISLTENEYYYMEAKHLQHGGSDHMTFSVEIDKGTPGHHHSMREIQKLTVDQVLQRDKTIFTIQNPDSGSFIVNFINPLTAKYFTTQQIPTKATASQFQSVIKEFYSNAFGASITVDLVMYDKDGLVVTSQTLATKNVYTVTVLKSITVASTSYISVQKVSSTSIISWTYPKNVQLSNPPLKGSFVIQCDQADGSLNQTLDIDVKDASWQIRDKIIQACPQYRDNIDVWEGSKYNYIEDGRDIIIRFIGMNKDIPQFQIASSMTTPLVGNQLTFTQTTMVPYSSNLFYEPIPFEFLYTNELKPQVIVHVDDIEAVCDSLDCNYNYVPVTAKITDYSLSGNVLTITGTGLSATDIQSVMFSNTQCSVTSASTTQIVCTVTPATVAGTWKPSVTDSNGLIPLDTTKTLSVDLTVTSLTPNVDLNPIGGNVLTITGTGFPTSMNDGSTLTLTFDDGNTCTVLTTSSLQITCKTNQFNSATATSVLTVTVNDKSNSQKSVTVTRPEPTINQITPSTYSPVLMTTLTIKVSYYSGTLAKEDLSVTLVKKTNSSITKPLNVIEVSNVNGNKYIKVKYGGAYSGVYNVRVVSKETGAFDTSSIQFEAAGVVTAYSPQQGSMYGGTIITITGYTFSDDILDNPVKIGYTDCLVQSSSVNQITCRTEPRLSREEGSDDFLVFLKTSEQAKCTAAATCKYQWTKAGLPVVSSQAITWDSTLNDYVLTLTGTGFGSNSAMTELQIDGIKQTLISVVDSQAKFQLINLKDVKSTNNNFYLPIGTPEGADKIASLTFTPRLVSVTPNTGSPAGSLIRATVKGVGVNTKDVTLLNADKVDICQSVKIVSYGIIECKTKALTIATGSLKVKVGTSTYNCDGSCTYQTSTSMPIVTSVVLESDKKTLSFFGSGFSIAASTGKAIFQGVTASTTTVNSDTLVQAVWTNGVPIATAATIPELFFVKTGSTESHWATITSTVQNSVTATSIDSTVSCSYAGGCLLSISQPGLLTSLTNPANSISICGRQCTLSATDSSMATTKCYLPSLPTTYSVQNYNILTEDYITGTAFSSNSQYTNAVFDGSNQKGFADKSANCFFGTSFKQGYVGVLREVKYFMNRFTKDNFVGKLQFQGSNDGTTYTTIFTVGSEIHEGWNYYSYPQGSELKYRYYRFFGTAAGSCLVGEIKFRGFEVIDSTNSQHQCTAQLNLNGSPLELTGSITYTSTLTPLLTSITPRFGTVKGGETITLAGSNFVQNNAAYTIKIDGILCTVTSSSTTQVQCTTGSRPGDYRNDPTLDIQVSGYGSMATQGLVFRYVSYWSDETTWGNDFIPMEGDTIQIPTGLHLLVDVDKTPILNAILVEGSLIFPPSSDPNHLRTFDANYIMIRNGYMEVGTEKFPYTSKLIITMHGTRDSPELPIYGNKVIAVRNGILEMHGVTRTPTWTDLQTTVLPGATTITLIQQVDWKAGEKIVIAPTSYDNTEAEVRTIQSIDNSNPSKPVITLDSPLQFKHYAGIQTFGTETLEMRAEVGLLTRNVIFRGDPETSSLNQYGAHIMLHSMGDESLIGRIEYCEFTDVGQAFQLGRYPIHFHLIGTVHYSYVRGNSIHHTYNRAVTIHAVHYLRVQYNVAYKTMGHTFFIEDAVETKNLIEKNLAILTQRSWSLLNTDQTPASFWITHPDNIFRGNRAAGSDRYGYWFDTKPNSMGPSFDPNVCPENSPLGEFTDNVAHSNGRYGLRIFHKLIPRTNPCSPIVYDATNAADPYWKNPLITATFSNFVGYKNQRNGAIAEQVGDVRFQNFKVADNLIAGIEFSLTKDTMDGTAQINGALVVGHSANAEQITKPHTLDIFII